MTCLIGEIHHLLWKPLGEDIIHYLALAPSVTISPTPAPTAPAMTFLHPASPNYTLRWATCSKPPSLVWPSPLLMHPRICSRLLLGLHCGFCCQFLTGGLLYQWTSRVIIPNFPATRPLSLGGYIFPILEHVQIIEAPLLWNKLMR